MVQCSQTKSDRGGPPAYARATLVNWKRPTRAAGSKEFACQSESRCFAGTVVPGVKSCADRRGSCDLIGKVGRRLRCTGTRGSQLVDRLPCRAEVCSQDQPRLVYVRPEEVLIRAQHADARVPAARTGTDVLRSDEQISAHMISALFWSSPDMKADSWTDASEAAAVVEGGDDIRHQLDASPFSLEHSEICGKRSCVRAHGSFLHGYTGPGIAWVLTCCAC